MSCDRLVHNDSIIHNVQHVAMGELAKCSFRAVNTVSLNEIKYIK